MWIVESVWHKVTLFSLLLLLLCMCDVLLDWLYDAKCLFLSMPRVQLFERIDTRCEAIVEAGLFQVTAARIMMGTSCSFYMKQWNGME